MNVGKLQQKLKIHLKSSGQYSCNLDKIQNIPRKLEIMNTNSRRNRKPDLYHKH